MSNKKKLAIPGIIVGGVLLILSIICFIVVGLIEAEAGSIDLARAALEFAEAFGSDEAGTYLLLINLADYGRYILLVLGLGLIAGSIVLLCLKGQKKAAAPQAPVHPAAPAGICCLTCGTPAEPGAAFCGVCGSKIPVPTAAPAPVEAPAATYCAACGFELIPDALFCPNCGSKAAPAEPEVPVYVAPAAPAEPVYEEPVAPVVEAPVVPAAPVVEEIPAGPKCPACGTLVEADALFCPECGSFLMPTAAPVPAPAPAPAPVEEIPAAPDPADLIRAVQDSIVCYRCGSLNEAGSVFCGNCGNKLNG